MSEDEKVFAVIGVFIDFSGDSQLCLARDHKVVHIGHEFSQEWIAEAPPGLLLTPDITAERRISVLMSLLQTAGTLKGHTVATLAENGRTDGRVKDVIAPALKKLGVKRGSDGVLTITGTDFTAALAKNDPIAHVHRAAALEIGQAKSHAPVTAIRRAQDGKQSLVLIDGQQLSVAEGPAFGRKVPADDFYFANEWL
jgi:hypothetical protein